MIKGDIDLTEELDFGVDKAPKSYKSLPLSKKKEPKNKHGESYTYHTYDNFYYYIDNPDTYYGYSPDVTDGNITFGLSSTINYNGYTDNIINVSIPSYSISYTSNSTIDTNRFEFDHAGNLVWYNIDEDYKVFINDYNVIKEESIESNPLKYERQYKYKPRIPAEFHSKRSKDLYLYNIDLTRRRYSKTPKVINSVRLLKRKKKKFSDIIPWLKELYHSFRYKDYIKELFEDVDYTSYLTNLHWLGINR